MHTAPAKQDQHSSKGKDSPRRKKKNQHRNRENLSKITLESEAFCNLKRYLRKQPDPDQYDLKLQFQLPFKVNSRKPQMKQSISISFLGHTCKTLKRKADFHQLYAAKPPISRQNTRAELPSSWEDACGSVRVPDRGTALTT